MVVAAQPSHVTWSGETRASTGFWTYGRRPGERRDHAERRAQAPRERDCPVAMPIRTMPPKRL